MCYWVAACLLCFSHLPWHILAAVSKKLCKKNPSTTPSLPCPGVLGWHDQVPSTNCSVPEHTFDMAPLSRPLKVMWFCPNKPIHTQCLWEKVKKNLIYSLLPIHEAIPIISWIKWAWKPQGALWKERRQHFTAGGIWWVRFWQKGITSIQGWLWHPSTSLLLEWKKVGKRGTSDFLILLWVSLFLKVNSGSGWGMGLSPFPKGNLSFRR